MLKDLGILPDHQLNFIQHIFIITQKAMRILGFIEKIKNFHKISSLKDNQDINKIMTHYFMNDLCIIIIV